MNTTVISNSTQAPELGNHNVSNSMRRNASDNNVDTIILLQETTSYLWIILSPVLLVIGLFGNISIVAVLAKLKFWKKPTYILLFVLALADITVLCVGPTRYWTMEVFNIDLRSVTNIGCKVNVFVIYTSMQFSSMILVCITFERFLKTRYPFRYHTIVSIKKTIFLVICIFLLLTGLNVFWFETQGLVDLEGELSCEATTTAYFWFEEFIYTYVDLFVLSVFPFVAMVIMNIFINMVLMESKELRKMSVSDESTRKELGKFSRALTNMILFTSLYFLVATVPVSVYFITESYLAPDADDLTLAKMDVAWAMTYLFMFSNYVVNFFLYMMTNTAFKRAFLEICCCVVNKPPTRRGSRFVSTTQVSVVTSLTEGEQKLPTVSQSSGFDPI
ncbi:mu-type opioid receptor-like [Mytilus edulis]|uniref:mu-type opioid receptor-like n=1 Tax=Mytilus edulis TaxID=6550 RepID=UPI0039EDFBDE